MTHKILILGGSGRTGSAVLKKALSKGFEVVALVRDPEAISMRDPKLKLVKGSPLNPEDVAEALQGCDTVISTLNNQRISDSPFAKPKSPKNLMADSIANVMAAMNEQNVRRILVLGAAGVGDTYADVPWLFKLFINYTNLGIAYRDHNKVEAMLKSSNLDWTIGHAVMLGSKVGSGPIIQSYAKVPKPATQIHRDSVADFLLDNIDNKALFNKTPVISQK